MADFEQQLATALDVVDMQPLALKKLGDEFLIAFPRPTGTEAFDLLPGDSPHAHKKIEEPREFRAGGNIADTTFLERDRPRIPTLNQCQRARLAGQADHLDQIGDEECTKPTTEIDLICSLIGRHRCGIQAELLWTEVSHAPIVLFAGY